MYYTMPFIAVFILLTDTALLFLFSRDRFTQRAQQRDRKQELDQLYRPPEDDLANSKIFREDEEEG